MIQRGGGGGGVLLHPALMEERIVAQHREIQALLLDNQHLAATHVALKQELSACQQKLRQISAAASKVQAERDAQVREVYDRSLNMEAEVRSMDAMNEELIQVRGESQKLSGVRVELSSKLQAVNSDLGRVRAELQQVPAIKAEIEDLRQEIQKGRAAIEYEKKTHAENLEHEQAMEKNIVVLARELEKLRAELANAEKRARAAAAAAAAANPGPGYSGNYGNPEMGYGGDSYMETYGMHQVQGGSDSGSQYGSAAISHVPYDMPRAHVHNIQ